MPFTAAQVFADGQPLLPQSDLAGCFGCPIHGLERIGRQIVDLEVLSEAS